MTNEQLGLRDILVREAISLLASGGVDISLRSVARAAGVSAMAPYRHFEDKAALLGAVAEEGFDELRRDLEAADSHADGIEALIEQGLAYIAFAERRPRLFRMMFSGEDLVCRPVERGRTAYDVLAERVAALAPGRSDVGALACWATVHGMAMLALDRRIQPAPRETRAVLALLARAAAGQEPAHQELADKGSDEVAV